MKKTAKAIGHKISKPIKVKLDYKTFVILSKLSSLKMWKKKFPNAKVVYN